MNLTATDLKRRALGKGLDSLLPRAPAASAPGRFPARPPLVLAGTLRATISSRVFLPGIRPVPRHLLQGAESTPSYLRRLPAAPRSGVYFSLA